MAAGDTTVGSTPISREVGVLGVLLDPLLHLIERAGDARILRLVAIGAAAFDHSARRMSWRWLMQNWGLGRRWRSSNRCLLPLFSGLMGFDPKVSQLWAIGAIAVAQLGASASQLLLTSLASLAHRLAARLVLLNRHLLGLISLSHGGLQDLDIGGLEIGMNRILSMLLQAAGQIAQLTQELLHPLVGALDALGSTPMFNRLRVIPRRLGRS